MKSDAGDWGDERRPGLSLMCILRHGTCPKSSKSLSLRDIPTITTSFHNNKHVRHSGQAETPRQGYTHTERYKTD